MIEYDQRSCGGLQLIFKAKGSVYVAVLPYALFSAVSVYVLKSLAQWGDSDFTHIFNHPYVYQVYTFVLGFVIVFRCNLAYQRFWEGRSCLELMTSKWSDAALQSVVFDNIARKPEMDRRAFRARILSLFSLLHATALCQLHDNEDEMEVIEGVDQQQVFFSINSAHVKDPVFLCFTWIQDTLIRREDNGGIPVPPPICTRLFQEMSNGMLGFNNANKIHNTPFPFPYAQLITLALMILTLTCGFVMNVFVSSAFWAALFSFLAVAGYYAINEVAIELEDPFGDDANDLPMTDYQRLFNHRLRPLLRLDEGPFRTPALEVAFAAMACTYDEHKKAPLSPQAITESYQYYAGKVTGEEGAAPPTSDGTRYVLEQFQPTELAQVEEPIQIKWVNQDTTAEHMHDHAD